MLAKFKFYYPPAAIYTYLYYSSNLIEQTKDENNPLFFSKIFSGTDREIFLYKIGSVMNHVAGNMSLKSPKSTLLLLS